MRAMAAKYKDAKDVVVELDFATNTSIYDADILITDWSCIAYEYAFTTKRPPIFINTPMKVVNPEWQKIGIVPTTISMRDMVGFSVEETELGRLPGIIDEILANPNVFRERIDKLLTEYYFNPGHAGEVAGEYILESLISRKKGKEK
jgi:YidC/Oxa1 family membrane protein insertase